MEIGDEYSHLNGKEYLLVHHPDTYEEIVEVIEGLDAEDLRTKVSEEKTMRGKLLYNPTAINSRFGELFRERGWEEERYTYYITTDYQIVQEIAPLPLERQKEELAQRGIEEPLYSYKQVDFVKDNIAIEVQFGKYAFVAYDLFVKHLLFYSGGVINVGIEMLPMKAMQSEMSTGIAYFEGEVYNILRHGRTSPPVPLFIIGLEP